MARSRLSQLPTGRLAVAAVVAVIALSACSGIGSGAPVTTAGGPSASAVPTALPPSSMPSELPPGPTGPTGPAPSPSPSPTAAVLVGAGDIASCRSSGDAATAQLLAGIDGVVFTAGDNVYDNGTPKEFADCYAPTWGRFLDRTLPVPGNHDYNTTAARGYFGYFGARAGDPTQGWYAVDVGTWRVYALNSDCWAIGGCGPGSPQERWLRDDLATNPRPCTLAIWHHPRFSSGQHGSDAMTADLWRALDDAGAELVINGHDHDYERFAPQDADGRASPNGIVEIVAGTGGRSHYTLGAPVANSLVRDDTAYGVVRLELGVDGWSMAFVPVAGASFADAASGACH